MILKSLVLKDVGVYAGEQRIDFAPPSRDKPVTLVGGLNGAGKTTLMRSLFHVLYGAHALPLMERRGSYDRYLSEITRADANGARLELTFSVQRNGQDDEISICRSWRKRGASFVEDVEASRNGARDDSLADGWLDFVESIVPRGIARLVFFDGEKVEALADLENASATLRTAVGSLLGLDLVDQLAIDLEVLQRRRTTASASPEEQEQLGALDATVCESEAQLTRCESELDDLRLDLHEATERLTAAEDAFRAAGGDFFERRASLLTDYEEAKHGVVEAETHARVLAAGELTPLLLIEDEVARLAGRAQAEREAENLKTTRAVVQERDTFVSNLLEELDAPAGLQASVVARLQDARDLLHARLESLPPELGLSEAASVLEELHSGELAGLDERRRASLTAIEDAQARLDHVERLAAQIPTEEAVRALERERADAADRVALIRAKVDAAESARLEAQRALDRAKSDRKRYSERLADAQLERLDSERLVAHAERARVTLERLRELAAARNVDRIAELAIEALEQLFRKDRLISEMSIDPVTFVPSFRDRSGLEIHPEQLSAGERQLTALALLWALARASGRPLPVLIDTPLGRLDSAHRHHVVNRYLPMASQQVIVLSTDTEIETRLHGDLDRYIGASYELSFDEAAAATSITPGYLNLPAAA